MKLLVPLIWISFLGAFGLMATEQEGGNILFLLALWEFGIYQVVTDEYLTGKEKRWCIIAILLCPIICICLVQLYSSAMMRKRFKLDWDSGIVQP